VVTIYRDSVAALDETPYNFTCILDYRSKLDE